MKRFISTLVDRLTAVEFPQDIFTSRLEAPITQLNDTTTDATTSVRQISDNVKNAAKTVSSSIDKINTKAESLTAVLSVVETLSTQQQAMLSELDKISQLNTGVNVVMNKLAESISENREVADDFRKAWLNITRVSGEMGDVVKGSMEMLTPAIVSLEVIAKQSAAEARAATASVESFGGLMGQLIELNKAQLEQGATVSRQLKGVHDLSGGMKLLNENLAQIVQSGSRKVADNYHYDAVQNIELNAESSSPVTTG
jgi:hypothetical protein